MNLSITQRAPYDPLVEFVERKGIGHPDTICDHLAEELARDLAATYLEKTGRVQAFNVDKAVLAAGAVDIGFGGGTHVRPSRLIMVGKADSASDWKPDPAQLAIDTEQRLLELLPDANPEAFDVEVWLNPSSIDLAAVVTGHRRGEVPLANDTSFAAVSLPRSPLEDTVWRLERYLNTTVYRSEVPIGRDIKVMGARTGADVTVTIAVPVLAGAVGDRAAYDEVVGRVRVDALAMIRDVFGETATVMVNEADNRDAQYLTLTGTSAEAGDDGQVGRGNRFGGLITPYRPMSLEAAAGKNPAAHVGKTYHAFADDIGRRVIADTGAEEVTVRMLSAIGHPVTDPQAIHVELAGVDDDPTIMRIVAESLEDWEGVRDRLIAGEYELY
jgi:S-adenosylmethionine synthetase